MTDLDPLLDRLAAFEPTTLPVLSLYLNTSSDQHGRDDYASFLRKELKAAGTTFPLRSPERTSFERDTERINSFIEDRCAISETGAPARRRVARRRTDPGPEDRHT
jgi:hypothetical protein